MDLGKNERTNKQQLNEQKQKQQLNEQQQEIRDEKYHFEFKD